MPSILLNGEPDEVREPATVATLLVRLGLDPRVVAVERNRHIVPREEFARTALVEGDALEVVTFVGGG